MPTYSWNVLFYAVAGDAQEEAALAQHLADMAAALTTDQCAIAAQINTRSAMTRHWILRGDARRDAARPPVDISTATALREFLDVATARHDADSTLLVMCGHGSGLDDVREVLGRQLRWIRSTIRLPRFLPKPGFPRFPRFPIGVPYRWGPNPVTGTFLGNLALRDAIATSQEQRVDILGLNACWMGMLEVAHALRDVASLQLASQVYATRWPYRAIIKALSAAPRQSAEQLATAVVACVRGELQLRRRDSIAAIRSGSHLEALASAVDDYAKAATPLLVSHFDGVVDALVDKVLRVDDPHQVDLASLASVLGGYDAAVKAAGASVRAALDAAVVAKAVYPSRGDLQGLSLFCPIIKNLDLDAAYQGLDFAGNAWADFLTAWQAKLPSYA